MRARENPRPKVDESVKSVGRADECYTKGLEERGREERRSFGVTKGSELESK